ncbi:unnamed protein product [Durusdinium trenchii]|uniref:C3H1-type domain-containing protein n=1 Tax=Durusdinium trenchii TaxID=1381693 RepID=A0ABP0JSX6_9DINO
MIEALFFLDGTAKFIQMNLHSVVSGRCRGVARDMYLGKDPLLQKSPLTVFQVRALEELMQTETDANCCIIGQLLFCLHACCRWRDSQRLQSAYIEHSKGESVIHADALSSKTSLTLDAKTRFLPYVAIGTGLMGEDWAKRWLSARVNQSLNFKDFALPSFSMRTMDWTDTLMSSSEATAWLREFLSITCADFEPKKYASHSLKTTVLTWAGRSVLVQFSPTERRLLGHHVDPSMRSVLTYSREAYTTLYSKVFQMYLSIRNGQFQPDSKAIDRILESPEGRAATASAPAVGAEVVGGSDSESSLASDSEIDERVEIGIEQWLIDKIVDKNFASFGRFAFSVAYSPQHPDDRPFKTFIDALAEVEVDGDQFASLRRLFFEAHTMALADVRSRVGATPDPAVATKKLPTAERVSRQADQEQRLGGIIFTPDTIPSNHLVDLFVEMCETGILTYVKPEQCCSRALEVNSIKKDPAISTDASGLLKVGSKASEPTCEANTELKLRAAWQRRSLAMDLSGIASFEVIETWVQYLFQQLIKDQPRGFSKISLQQVLECDRALFVQASHTTMGRLQSTPPAKKPLDEAIVQWKAANEVLQYLTPLPSLKGAPQDPTPANHRPTKIQKVDKAATKGVGKATDTSSKPKLPEGCVSHDDKNRPLCFGFQTGKCKFKGPPGKRCARGFHLCYKAGCHRPKPHHLCTHTD